MEKALERTSKLIGLFHFLDDQIKKGLSTDLRGNCTGLRGDCTGLWGNCTGLSGNCTDLSGDCTGLWGDCTGLRGDIDEAKLTEEERKNGVDITLLVKEK